jgi:hypothetical protein
MAVTQISRIQHRRGLEQDLPQLSSAELGWSVDTRKLYIGNGTVEEGAPTVGVTRVLTEYDVATLQSSSNDTYTFGGDAAGYVAQTGPSVLSPVIRSIQQKLDDAVNVRDFGATGNGVTDDTAAINRAIQQIYSATSSPVNPLVRRTIYFPGGTYLTSGPILIPPYATLIGDGLASAIIKQQLGNQTVANVCDSAFQTGSSIGAGSATAPTDIEVIGIQFYNANSVAVSAPILGIDSASKVKFTSSKFISGTNSANLVQIYSTVSTTKQVTFENCSFLNAGNGITVANALSSMRVIGGNFGNLTHNGIHLGTSTGFVGIGNYFDGVTQQVAASGNNLNVSLGDNSSSPNILQNGLFLGNFQYSPSEQYTITTTPLVLTPIANSASCLNYEIRSGANARLGTFAYTVANQIPTAGVVYEDSYVETALAVDANMSANTDSILVSVSSGTATLKFNFKRFF